MDFKQLQHITTIAQEKNISKAAQKLYVSQSALSLSLKDIERELDCTLFQRSTHGLSITYEGERFVDTAQHILASWDRLKREIKDIKNEKSGRVKLGMSSSRSPYILPSLVNKLHSINSNIDIDVMEGFSLELEEQLKKGTLDLAVYPLPLRDNSLSIWREVREEIFICVNKNNPLLNQVHYDREHNRKWLDIEDIKDEPIFLLHPGQKLRVLVDGLYSKIGVIPNAIFTTYNLYTAINLVKIGCGITYTYTHPQQFINVDELELISISSAGVYRPIGIVYNPSIYFSKAAELTANMLILELSGRQSPCY